MTVTPAGRVAACRCRPEAAPPLIVARRRLEVDLDATPHTAAAQRLLAQVTARHGNVTAFVDALRQTLDPPTDRLPQITTQEPPARTQDLHEATTSPLTTLGRHALREPDPA
ncbi:hypothetical protein [Nocardia sp. NPDC050435]|uniref:hypothetical protein n=1 Tax=Nocardia sp. NPDC050435 TaxID=3155040 RepID=UPI00340B8CD7